MGVRFPPPAPSKLTAYQLVGFFTSIFVGVLRRKPHKAII